MTVSLDSLGLPDSKLAGPWFSRVCESRSFLLQQTCTCDIGSALVSGMLLSSLLWLNWLVVAAAAAGAAATAAAAARNAACLHTSPGSIHASSSSSALCGGSIGGGNVSMP